MNDYRFGNYLTELRKRSGMTQQLLAHKVGVTDKAVSKWENGRSKPALPQLKKLSEIYRVSIDDLMELMEERRMEITKIVLTGGPCAGKTTAMTHIQKEFEKRGYRVLFVPETATELIGGGVAPWTCGSNLDYQKCQVSLQKYKEEIFEQAASTMDADKILIVCDRGVLDNKAYMTQEDFDAIMRALGTNEVSERDQYDAVFHMVTAAKGAVEAYTTEHVARTETPEKAAELDDALIAAWTGHPHLRVIDNSSDFDEKLHRTVAEIASFLGEPEPMEIERKYLIRYPDLLWLEDKPNCSKVDMIQTYLNTLPDGTEVRVRQRGQDGNFICYKTEKRRISDVSRVEVDRRIDMKEYVSLLAEADSSRRPVHKTRYCLTENNRYYEIDIYPEWKNQAVMELELKSEDEEVVFPEGIRVIREVTQDRAYTNYEMAAHMPEEK